MHQSISMLTQHKIYCDRLKRTNPTLFDHRAVSIDAATVALPHVYGNKPDRIEYRHLQM